MFEIGQITRRSEIHARHGGQEQGGISTPKGRPYLLLFSGGGESYGYDDHWDENRVFHYSGVSHVGDMEFRGGNRAVRDHITDGKDLHLFEQVQPGHVRYLGCFVCCSWNSRRAKDKSGNLRRAIIFHLVPLAEHVAPAPASRSGPTQLPLDLRPLDELRKKAYAGAAPAEEANPRKAKQLYRERSEGIHLYVLKRAGGVCEACGRAAPFTRIDGSPYLEPHHTRRHSDGGPGHPRWVGAVCPNCHREIHHGVRGEVLNRKLEEHLGTLESDKS